MDKRVNMLALMFFVSTSKPKSEHKKTTTTARAHNTRPILYPENIYIHAWSGR
jgi:hypothetical protein